MQSAIDAQPAIGIRALIAELTELPANASVAMRVLQGLLGKRKKYSKQQIEEACKKALFNAQFRLREIEQHLNCHDQQQSLEFISEHELIRDTASYAQILCTQELFNP